MLGSLCRHHEANSTQHQTRDDCSAEQSCPLVAMPGRCAVDYRLQWLHGCNTWCCFFYPLAYLIPYRYHPQSSWFWLWHGDGWPLCMLAPICLIEESPWETPTAECPVITGALSATTLGCIDVTWLTAEGNGFQLTLGSRLIANTDWITGGSSNGCHISFSSSEDLASSSATDRESLTRNATTIALNHLLYPEPLDPPRWHSIAMPPLRPGAPLPTWNSNPLFSPECKRCLTSHGYGLMPSDNSNSSHIYKLHRCWYLYACIFAYYHMYSRYISVSQKDLKRYCKCK